MRRCIERFLPDEFLDSFCAGDTSNSNRKTIVEELLAKLGTSKKKDLFALHDETNAVNL